MLGELPCHMEDQCFYVRTKTIEFTVNIESLMMSLKV